MADPYPVELRTRVLADFDAGLGTKATATKFKVSPAWVRRLVQQRRERGGDIAPRTGGGARASLTKIDRVALAEAVKRRPDATLLELADDLGVACAKSAIWKALRRLGLSYKKSPSAPRSRTGRTSRNCVPNGR